MVWNGPQHRTGRGVVSRGRMVYGKGAQFLSQQGPWRTTQLSAGKTKLKTAAWTHKEILVAYGNMEGWKTTVDMRSSTAYSMPGGRRERR